jgi:hypothetical protein
VVSLSLSLDRAQLNHCVSCCSNHPQKMMAMRQRDYVAVNYLINIGMYATVAAFFWITGYGIEFGIFARTSSAFVFLFLFGWGLGTMCA